VASDSQAPGRDTAAAEQALTGVRVIDVTHMLAGPYCTWVMGALGADVIKVEVPERGDFTRRLAPFLGDESIYFLSLNRNKRSVTLNLKSEAGRDALLRLVRDADVLVENNRPGVMARLGLDYAALSAGNPRLVYASVSGFGQTGPYSARPAYDAVVQAMAGTMSITGEEGRGPVRVGASIGDMGAGLFATIGHTRRVARARPHRTRRVRRCRDARCASRPARERCRALSERRRPPAAHR
jgi:CoA:oxalate CoA-transferase